MLRKAALLACFALAPLARAQHDWGTRPDGAHLTSLASRDARAVVLFFVASDCPISNRTFPEMQRLRREFSTSGVAFWYVYPNSGETGEGVAQHQASFDNGGQAVLAPGVELVRLTHAVATPEVSVLRPGGADGWTPVYTGRVDDRYVSFGHERTQVTQHFAEDAIKAVLAGKMPQAPVGKPVGCAIMNPGAVAR